MGSKTKMFKGKSLKQTYIVSYLDQLATMLGWYLCADVKSAVDAYDMLGVQPGPDDAQHTPFQRAMQLSTVPMKTITKCYHQTLQSIGEDAQQALCIHEAYTKLQGKSRESYDVQRFKETAQVSRHILSAFWGIVFE